MIRLITKQGAAKILGCDERTVENWLNKGIIKSHMINNTLMLDRDSIERHFDNLEDLLNMEKRIEEMKFELQEVINEKSEILNDLRGCFYKKERNRKIFKTNQLTLLSMSEGYLQNRDRMILTDIITGKTPEGIGKKMGLSHVRVFQIAINAANKLSFISELKKIQEENKILKEEINQLYKAKECYMKSTENKVSTIFDKRLNELPISERTLNALESLGCDTLGDLVKYKKSDLRKLKNFGMKSFTELNDLILKLGLDWGMNPDNTSSEKL